MRENHMIEVTTEDGSKMDIIVGQIVSIKDVADSKRGVACTIETVVGEIDVKENRETIYQKAKTYNVLIRL